MTPGARAAAGFARHFGGAPDGVSFAPGRVNLIGEHIDYNDGLVLPMPIAAGTAVAWRAQRGEEIAAVALDIGETHDHVALGSVEPTTPVGWRTYLRGMAAEMRAAGLPVGGARLAISGSITRGTGLSSSASLCVAIGRALAAAAGGDVPAPHALALAAQAAERRWAGVNCGIMDQMAIAAGKPGSALLLDCRSLDHRIVPLPSDWSVMIAQSGVVRGLVDGQYNQRRRDCEAAATILGVASLRDTNLASVEATDLDPTVRRRARHVVGEIARTRAAVAAIEQHDLARLGVLIRQSHASLRDLFDVSTPAVDALADCLNAAIGGEGGARITGGGFGGAVVALLPTEAVPAVRRAVQDGYQTPAGTAPDIIVETVSSTS